MTRYNLIWHGTLATTRQRACIRRCILQYTSETTETYDVFGMLLHDPHLVDTTVPFEFHNRLFLAIFREEFCIFCEDNCLNIKVLIDLWDCKPVDYLQLPFADVIEVAIPNH